MRLSIKERIQLPMILPSQGGMIEMIALRDIIRQIEITPAEIEDYEIKDLKDGSYTFNPKKAREKSLELTTQQVDLLKKSLKEYDEAGKVTLEMLPLCEKINDLEL